MAIHKSQDEDTETYSRAHFGQRVGFGHVFAVLVVDMSRAFTSDSYSVGHRDDRLVESVGVLLNEARKAGCPIIYTTTSYSDPEQAGYWGVKIPGLTELRDSDPNTRLIHEELAPRAEDVVI